MSPLSSDAAANPGSSNTTGSAKPSGTKSGTAGATSTSYVQASGSAPVKGGYGHCALLVLSFATMGFLFSAVV